MQSVARNVINVCFRGTVFPSRFIMFSIFTWPNLPIKADWNGDCGGIIPFMGTTRFKWQSTKQFKSGTKDDVSFLLSSKSSYITGIPAIWCYDIEVRPTGTTYGSRTTCQSSSNSASIWDLIGSGYVEGSDTEWFAAHQVTSDQKLWAILGECYLCCGENLNLWLEILKVKRSTTALRNLRIKVKEVPTATAHWAVPVVIPDAPPLQHAPRHGPPSGRAMWRPVLGLAPKAGIHPQVPGWQIIHKPTWYALSCSMLLP